MTVYFHTKGRLWYWAGGDYEGGPCTSFAGIVKDWEAFEALLEEDQKREGEDCTEPVEPTAE